MEANFKGILYTILFFVGGIFLVFLAVYVYAILEDPKGFYITRFTCAKEGEYIGAVPGLPTKCCRGLKPFDKYPGATISAEIGGTICIK